MTPTTDNNKEKKNGHSEPKKKAKGVFTKQRATAAKAGKHFFKGGKGEKENGGVIVCKNRTLNFDSFPQGFHHYYTVNWRCLSLVI